MTVESDTDQLLGEVHRHGADIQVEDDELVLYGGKRVPPKIKESLREYRRNLIVALHEVSERKAGRIPDRYQDIAKCQQCGLIWLDIPGHVPSCPWCINRYNGWPIPRPKPVTCATCRHFRRRGHPHLGDCSAGVRPYAAAGFGIATHTAARFGYKALKNQGESNLVLQAAHKTGAVALQRAHIGPVLKRPGLPYAQRHSKTTALQPPHDGIWRHLIRVFAPYKRGQLFKNIDSDPVTEGIHGTTNFQAD